jgi:polar amino acid transport system substrate-binding protein
MRLVRWVALLLLFATVTGWVGSAQTRTLRLVSTAWPPFTNAPGQPRFALDLVEAALTRIQVNSNTTIVAPAQFTTSLLTGPFDGSAAAWRDSEREKALIFSEPLLENRLVLVGRRGADVSAKALGALKGKRIALVEGYAYGDDVDRSGPTFVRSQTEEDSLALLLKGEVDYTLMDDLVVQYIVDHYANESRARLQFGATPMITRSLHFVLRRDQLDAQGIINRFNAQLRGMITDRTYHRLLHVDWIRADVDGDGLPEIVPQRDQMGPAEPLRSYALASDKPESSTSTAKPRYMFGSTIYESWALVPQTYKSYASEPDPNRSSGTIFRFRF